VERLAVREDDTFLLEAAGRGYVAKAVIATAGASNKLVVPGRRSSRGAA
jgi:hypothetical protein